MRLDHSPPPPTPSSLPAILPSSLLHTFYARVKNLSPLFCIGMCDAVSMIDPVTSEPGARKGTQAGD